MPNNIYHKRNANSGVIPAAAQLTVGEIALNTADGKAYTRTTAGAVVELTEASVADGGEQFTPLNVSNLAVWLDASDAGTLYQTEAANFSAVTTPLELGNCVLWLDGADAASMFDSTSGGNQVTAGGTVARWQDKSGGNRHVVQTNASRRPTMLTNSLNSRAILRFDGVDDRLNYGGAAANFVRPVTLFVVARKNNTQIDGGLFSLEKAGQNSYDNDSLFCLTTNSNGAAIRALGGTAASMYPGVGDPADTLGTFITSLLISPSTSTTAELRNVAAAQLATDNVFTFSSNPTNDGFVVGNISTSDGASGNVYPHPLNGDIAEIVAYSVALSPQNRVRVEKYLAAKWGLENVHTSVAAGVAGQPVGAWLDKSGNGRHAMQNTASARPTISTALQNGRRTIRFTQSSSQWFSLGDLSAAFPSYGEVFVAYTPNGTDLAFNLYGTRYNVGYYQYVTDGFGYPATFMSTRLNNVQHFSAATGSHVISQRVQNNVYVHRKDGAQVYSQATSFDGGNAHHIGGWPGGDALVFLDGSIHEVIVYNSPITAEQRRAIEVYLANKWGTTTLAPQVINADAQDWINRVYANGGTVNLSTAAAVNTFCNAIDAAGIRDRFYRLNLFCGDNLAACLTPLYRGPSLSGTQFGNATDTNNNFTSSDYNERGTTGGLIGNGASKNLDTGVNLVFSSQTDTHLAAYETLVGSGNDRSLIGADALGSTPRSIYTLYQLNPSTTTYYDGTDAGTLSYLATRPAGMWIGSNQPARRDIFLNGSSVAASASAKTGVGTSATPTYRVFALARESSTTGFSSSRLAGYSLGFGLTAAQALAYYNAAQAFQTTLARNV